MAIQNDQTNAVESTTLSVSAANGVLANDTASNGPLTIADDFILKRTAAGGQIKFAADGSYQYVSAPGFSGTDSVQYTALDAADEVVGTATLTINVTPRAQLPFVSVGSQLSEKYLVTAGFGQIGNGVSTTGSAAVALSGGGYVVPVVYEQIAAGNDYELRTYDANNNLVGVFKPDTLVFSLTVKALTNGTYAAGWYTRDLVTNALAAHVQVLSATGAPLSAAVDTDSKVLGPISALPGGGFVVLYADPTGYDVRTFSAEGVPESQSYRLDLDALGMRFGTILPNGEIVLTKLINNSEDLSIQRFDTHGNPIGAEIAMPNDGFRLVGGNNQTVTALSGGGFVVSWMTLLLPETVHQPLHLRTHVVFVDAQGNAGNEIVVPNDVDMTTAFGLPRAPVTVLENGNFVVYWRGVQTSPGQYLQQGQVFDADGTPVSGMISFAEYPGSGIVRLIALPQGGFAVAPDVTSQVDRANNLQIYDNNGGHVGDVRLEDLGDGSDASQYLLTRLTNGDILVLGNAYDATLNTGTVTTQTVHFDTPTPVIETGTTFDTVAKFPVSIFLPDPDGSEVVQWFDVSGVPAGWTLTAPTASAVLHSGVWTITGVDIAHGGKIDLVLTPNAPVSAAATLTVVAHTIEGENSSQKQSFPATFTVTLQTGPVTTGTTGDDSYTAAGNQRIEASLGTDTVTFGFKLTDATISFSGNQVIVDGPGSHTVLTGIEVFKFTDGTVDNADGNRLVDDLYYYARYHDVWNAHVDADAHYAQYGWHENRDPSAFFDTSLYLALNGDVKAAGINPLVHFDLFGWKNGRMPSLDFDPAAYLAANPDVKAAGIDPLAHFLQNGAQEGRKAIPFAELFAPNGFDYVYYLNKNPDVAAAGVDPFLHFQQIGWREGRNPNALFDTRGYLAAYTDVKAAAVNPLDHYHQFGAKENRDPSVLFDSSSYLTANPDVKAAGVDPLAHYLGFGRHEGRLAFADGVWG